MLDVFKSIGPSVIRTVAPWLVGLAVTLLAKARIEWTPTPEAFALAATVVSTAWYALIRWLETQGSSSWGWLLGLPKAPVYDAKHAE